MKDAAKPWMVKVLTDLGTRLLIVIEPHLLVKDLQGAIEHDHRAAYPGCGEVKCQLLSVLEYEDGRDIPSSVHSRYRLQDVLQRGGARVYAEFLDKAIKNTACLGNGISPLQLQLSPYLTPSDPGARGALTSPRGLGGQNAVLKSIDVSMQAQASPGIGSKRSMEGPIKPNQERVFKKARHDAQHEAVNGQADLGAAALPSHQPVHGFTAADSHDRVQLHGAGRHVAEAAAHSAGRSQQGMQPNSVHRPAHSDQRAKAALQIALQQPQQQKPPSPVHSKQGEVAHDTAHRAAGLSQNQGMQQGAEAESSSEAGSSSEEDSLPGEELAPSGTQAQQRSLASQLQLPQQQQQQDDSQPAAHSLQKAGGAQSSSSSEEESSSSSEGKDNQPKPLLSKSGQPQEQQQQRHQKQPPLPQQHASQPASQRLLQAGGAQSSSGEEESSSPSEEEGTQPDPLLSKSAQLRRASTNHMQQASAKHGPADQHGRKEDGSSSEEESTSESDSPPAQQQATPVPPVPPVLTQQCSLPQQAGQNGRLQDKSSSGEGETESSKEERSSEPAAVQNSRQAAQDQAQQSPAQGPAKSDNSSNSSSESDEEDDLPDEARPPDPRQQPDLAHTPGGKPAGSDVAQQPGSKASVPQQHVLKKATPVQNGPGGWAAHDESSSSEESESSDAEPLPSAAGYLGGTDTTADHVSAQRAVLPAGKDDGPAQQRSLTPVAHDTQQGAEPGHEAAGHALAGGGASAAHDEESSSSDEDDNKSRNGQRLVPQKEYELLQILRDRPDIDLKVLLEAQTAKRRQSAGKQPATQASKQAVAKGKGKGGAAGPSQRRAGQAVQRAAGADKDGDEDAGAATASQQHPSTPPLSDAMLLGRVLRNVSEEKLAQQQAKRKKDTDDPFSEPPEKMTDQKHLKKILRENLHKIVAHEQGLDLKTAAGMFRSARQPSWWPVACSWDKSQLNRATIILQQIYKPARERWQNMQRSAQQGQAK